MQTETLQTFQSRYLSEPWRVIHEQPFDELKSVINDLRNDVHEFDRIVQDELLILSNTSQNIIQLVLLECFLATTDLI